MKELHKYGAHWCGPCRSLDQVLDQIEDKITIKRFDMDDDDVRETAKNLGVRAIPMLFLIDENGDVIDSKNGLADVDELLDFIGCDE